MSTYVALKKRPYARKMVNTQPRKLPMVLYKSPRGRSLINPKIGSTAPELKNIDTGGSIGVLVGTSWSELDFLNPIQVGADSNNRLGRKVQLKSLLFRWNASTNTQNFPIRILIVYDREPNQAIPLITDVIASPAGFNSPLNLSNSNRFIVLADEIHEVVNTVGVGLNFYGRANKIFKNMNLPSIYLGSSIDVTTVTAGAVFAMCSIPGVAPAGNPGIGYFARVRYTDV